MEDGPDVAACSANYARPMDDELTPKERTTRVGRLLALLLFATLVGGIVGAVIGYAVGEDCPPDAYLCFVDRNVTAIYGAMIGLPVGLVGGFILWPLISGRS
jgi:hypothetical protein